jgi:hypothetical protein
MVLLVWTRNVLGLVGEGPVTATRSSVTDAQAANLQLTHSHLKPTLPEEEKENVRSR